MLRGSVLLKTVTSDPTSEPPLCLQPTYMLTWQVQAQNQRLSCDLLGHRRLVGVIV